MAEKSGCRSGVGDSIRIGFSELEDFHPDRVFERLEVFGKLRELKARVQDPAKFKEAEEWGCTPPKQFQTRPV